MLLLVLKSVEKAYFRDRFLNSYSEMQTGHQTGHGKGHSRHGDIETVLVARWDVGLDMGTNYTTRMAAHRHNIKSQQSGVMQFVWGWHQDYGSTVSFICLQYIYMCFPVKSNL